jgi:hypothetical protein
LAEVADRIAGATRKTVTGSGPYSKGFVDEIAAKQGCSYGSLSPTRLPAWEAVASAAAEELQGGATGFCWESRLKPAWFAARIRAVLGVPFPDDARSCIAYHLAILRGAARKFDAPWGVSIYGQMDAAAADLLFPMAYDAGATYFWLWTSDGDHHVPFTRQLELVGRLRAYQAAHPRAEGARGATHAAEVALCVPRGCPLDELSLSLGEPGNDLVPWGQASLRRSRVDPRNPGPGAAVSAAIRTAVTLLGRTEAFDIVPVDEGQTPDGYRKVVRVSPDGVVTGLP